MNDKVIYPAQFTVGRQERASRSESTGADISASRIARLRRIEKAREGAKKGPVFVKKSDRIAAARAVGRLVATAKSQGVTIEMIRNRLEDSVAPGKKPGTSRLDRYMLSARLTSVEVEERWGKLQQRAFGYLDAAQAIADLSGMDPDEAKCEVLSNTSLWSQSSQEATNLDERAAQIGLGLSEMGQYVIEKSGLAKIFERARRVPGVWDVVENRFRQSSMACLFQNGYLDGFEHWTEAPPLPGIPLVRHLHSMLICPVIVATKGSDAPVTSSEDMDGTQRLGNFMLFREIRLVLGPTTDAASIGVMFESRARVKLALDDKTCTLHPDVSLKPIDDVRSDLPVATFHALIGELWHRVTTLEALDDATCFVVREGDDVTDWALDPSKAGGAFEHWYFSWTACNEETVRLWLDHPLRHKGAVEECVPRNAIRTPTGERWYTTPSAALEVECALASGALEKALIEQVEMVREQLAVRESEWRQAATASMSDLIDGWKQQNAENDKGN